MPLIRTRDYGKRMSTGIFHNLSYPEDCNGLRYFTVQITGIGSLELVWGTELDDSPTPVGDRGVW